DEDAGVGEGGGLVLGEGAEALEGLVADHDLAWRRRDGHGGGPDGAEVRRAVLGGGDDAWLGGAVGLARDRRIALGVADDRDLIGVGLEVGAAVEWVDPAAILTADALGEALGAD